MVPQALRKRWRCGAGVPTKKPAAMETAGLMAADIYLAAASWSFSFTKFKGGGGRVHGTLTPLEKIYLGG
jgi:hypothetical protein